MKILINGTPRTLEQTVSVYQLLQMDGLESKRVAVELNEEILPRSQHASRLLQDGDTLEIVHAIGGG